MRCEEGLQHADNMVVQVDLLTDPVRGSTLRQQIADWHNHTGAYVWGPQPILQLPGQEVCHR
jgi:hypothetical protein